MTTDNLDGLRRALARGTKLRTLRIAVAVCPTPGDACTLAEVFRGDDGRRMVVYYRHEDDRGVRPLGDDGAAFCSCRHGAQLVMLSELTAAIGAGERRLVVAPHTRTRPGVSPHE